MKHILTCSFGKDSIATALLALQHGEPLDELVYSEVMFSDTVSGELPEHKRFIYETAIPYFEKRGIPTRVLRGQKTYLDCFYHIVSRGNAEGKLASFPLTGRCSIQRDCKLPPIRTYQKTLPQDTVYYLGIAADEPIRLARLKANQTSLLAKYNLTEKDAQAMCQAEGLLSPLYAFTGRGGCWFCPNASMRELRHLYNAHPDLWQLLLELQDAPNKARLTHELEVLTQKRKYLYNHKEVLTPDVRNRRLEELSARMRTVRRELNTCTDIETDAAALLLKWQEVRQAEKEEREVNENEQRRRSR